MVRNAGGRVFDAIRTLSVLQTIGAPGTIAVMHHTGMDVHESALIKLYSKVTIDCGMTHFHNADVRKALLEIAPEEKEALEVMKFGEIKNR